MQCGHPKMLLFCLRKKKRRQLWNSKEGPGKYLYPEVVDTIIQPKGTRQMDLNANRSDC